MSDDEKFFVSSLPNGKNRKVKINYNFKDNCFLDESQLYVYRDEKLNNTGTLYSNPFKIKLNKKFSVNEINNAVNKLYNIYPVLSAHIIKDSNNISFAFDAEPQVIIGSFDNVNSFISPFNLEKSLSKFLILEDRDANFLYIDIHQLIFDYSSLNIIVNKLFCLLNGDETDYVDEGILRQISLEDYLIDSEYKDNSLKFYESILSDHDNVSDLLPSIKNENNTDFKYTSSFDLDSNYFNSFLDDYSISIDHFFSSVFAYTLSRFTGSSTVLFNIGKDVRAQIDSLDSVGNFTQVYPLIFDCKNQNINTYLKSFSNLINSYDDYVSYPLAVLEEKYGLNSNILFQYSTKFYDCVEELEHDFVYDLSFYISFNDSVEIKVFYSDKYSLEFIERFVNVFKSILMHMMDVGELSELNYISNSDLDLLDSYNQKEGILYYDDVLDGFNDNLRKYPDNNLVLFKDKYYSYSEGAFIADYIAKKLIELGVKSQDKVAFLTERCEYYMFSVLGILSVGAVYVPLEDKHPDERIKFILDDTDSRVVIVSDETYNRVNNLTDKLIFNISDIFKGDIGCLEYLPVVYGDLACILYTSGSTGIPKGVNITRRSLINAAENFLNNYDVDYTDVVGLLAPMVFSPSSLTICVVICSGCCMAIIHETIMADMLKLNDYFTSHNVTIAFISSQVAKLFISSVDETSLDVLMVGGEKFGESVVPNNLRLIEGYGMTELMGLVSSIDISAKLDYSSVGFVNFNVKAYVLDEELRHVPVGAVGELYFAGYQLADGYLNRDDETSYAFRDNPYDNDEGFNRLYRTGDMVRFLPDGSLGIVGRRDSQLKIRGNRVELLEVEAVIREIGYVDDVTVQTIKNGSNNELVAYVVSNEEDKTTVEKEIRDYILDNKPSYMVPSFIIFIDKIPLNVNGKVDKKVLPKIDFDSLHLEYMAPRTQEEILVVNAFEKVLNQENIGLNDDFVKLGGNSLSAINLLSYLEAYNITAADIFSLRTPLEIARNLKKFSLNYDIYSLEEGCPLSESQLNVYLDIVAKNKLNSYLIPMKINIPNDYSVDRLIDGIKGMFDVHPILGMVVSDDFDVPYLVRSDSNPSILIESSSDEDFINEFLTKPFDLNESLSRFLIVENERDTTLYAVFHHLIFDGLSTSVFEHNLFEILNGRCPDVDDSFLKVSAFDSQIVEADEFKGASLFYESLLADVEDAGVLLDSVCSDGPGSYSVDLDVDVREFLANFGVSENILFTGVFAYTLSRFVGDEKVFFNIVENGRDRFNNLDSIGMFVNTLPLVVNCKNQQVSSFMDYMSDLIYGVLSYNFYPYRSLTRDYDINLDVIFQFMPDWFMDDYVTSDGISNKNLTDKIIGDMDDFISDLEVEVIQNGNDYILSINYSCKYSKDFIESFANTYKMILHDMINVEGLSEINYIGSSDLKLLDSYNDTDHDLAYSDILDAFNKNLENYSDNNLVCFMDRSYTYGEGAFIADRIAKSLMDLGVGVGDVVGFLVPRSELYVFSVLGIMSMGGVYVPLDDVLPDERLKFMLEDTGSKVVVVSDDTYERAESLVGDGVVLLNISDIISGDVGCLSSLPVVYGDLACILYTSGTTGVPKGVKVSRISALNISAYYADTYNLTNEDIFGMFVSIGFDAGSHAILTSLYAGASLSVVPNDIRLDMVKLNDYFIKQGVTQTFMTTQVGKLFSQSVNDALLDVLVVGGEKLGEFRSPGDYDLIDIYGPTEAFVFVASINNSEKIVSSSIGGLVYNTKAYILDEELRRVPMGAVGELYLAGHQISKGYLNNDELTSNSFMDNPFENTDSYSVMYKTGDFARYLPDGSLGMVGRRDGQVKIRGNRVELSEVEAVIRELDCVDDVTVQTIQNGENYELVAYVVSSELDDDELRNIVQGHVGEYKPDYMIPSYVIELDKIPLNVNGKVDRRALPDVDVDSLRVEYVAATNDVESAIVEAFESVFNQKGIGLYDDFTRLGGDSLTAIKIMSLLPFDLDVRTILNNRTPYNIAQSMKSENRDYGFKLVKRGSENQNMFLIPDIVGLSFVFSELIDTIDFEGNIYLIDDFKYDLTLDEIEKIKNNHVLALNYYYDAIKDLFEDGDIIVGYSLGCIYASLLVEKLEQTKSVGKCILIDGTLNYVHDVEMSKEEFMNALIVDVDSVDEYSDDFEDKLREICYINDSWNFNVPKVNSHIIYLFTDSNWDDGDLKEISSNYEFIWIDSTHRRIIGKDCDKISEYFK